jgi:hypothetical protein
MEELEAARLSIGQLEQEIDTRREKLTAAADAPGSGVRVVGNVESGEWLDDDASVRILPAAVMPVDEPVDADALVAEVEQLRASATAAEALLSPEESVEEPVDESVPVVVVDLDDRPPQEAPPEFEPTPTAAEPAPVEADAGEPRVAASADAAPSAEDEESVPDEPKADALSGLFEQLRSSDEEPEEMAAPDVQDDDTEAVDVVAAEPEPEPVEAEAPAIVVATDVDVFGLRDRLLLPVENRSLRTLKRSILDLQNRVLDELRVEPEGWIPDRTMFAAAAGDDVARFGHEAYVAGHAAAAEIVGASATPPPDQSVGGATASGFVDGLAEAVTEAISRSRTSGGGGRQVAAAVSRVFRAWRTDEAERRLRRGGRAAYHEGVIAAFGDLGVRKVGCIAPGHPCGKCPAGTGQTWTPGGPLPTGTALPPADADCEATVVPAE